MKTLKTMLTLLLAVVVSQTAFGSEDVIQIAVDDSNPPFMFRENDKTQGLYPVLLQAVFSRMGVEAEVKAYPWKRALKMGEDGKAGIGGIYKNEERVKIYDYSEPVYAEKLLLHVKKGKSFTFGKTEDLRGKSIGVIRGWSYGNEFDKARREDMFKVEETGNDDTNFKKLLLDRVDAVVAIDAAASQIIQNNGYQDKVEALSQPLAVNETYLVFAKKSNKNDLLNRFNSALAEMRKDGAYERIVSDFDSAAK